MDKHVKQVRNLRKSGRGKLTKLRSELTELAWDLTEKNETINDPQIKNILELIDQSLIEIEKALGKLSSIWLVERHVDKVKAESLHNYKF